ncbi:MAG: phosphatase PAP2 family protein [Elusimicrobia bacterium]|nr:phosphatase PAP2 family protein [Elusimicrobiota bacterium]
MKNLRKNLLLAAAALSLGACAHTAMMTSERQAAPASAHYVDPAWFADSDFPPPPAPDSMEQAADVAGVLAWQNKRTEEDCARARRTADEEYYDYWGSTSPFGAAVPAEFSDLFSGLAGDFEAALEVMKDRFRRPRPFVTYEEVTPCVKKKSSYSYPSGHASASRVTAEVLSDLVPERSDEFFAKADEIAQDRVVGGAHYPADVEAGKKFGDLFHERLLLSEKYRADLEKAKALLKR